nr:ribonuclease H-like domain-containing protein [Tanacetum cinerariifolium]
SKQSELTMILYSPQLISEPGALDLGTRWLFLCHDIEQRSKRRKFPTGNTKFSTANMGNKEKADETSGILRNFIIEIENLKEHRVKIIRCDNRGEFRNKEMNDFCSKKGIKREFNNARTPQQNRVAERRNRTLIEAARTMVLVNKSQNKTLYELFNGRTPAIGFLKPFSCHVMVLNTLENLRKFKAKGDEGYFIRYSMSRKAFKVQILLTFQTHLETSTSNAQDACNVDAPESSGISNPTATSANPPADHMETLVVETPIPTVSSLVPTACLNDSPEPSSDTRLISKRVTSQDDTPSLENILTLTNRFEDILGVTTNTYDTNGVEADLGNMKTTIIASPTPTLKIHKDHPKIYQMDVKSAFLYGTIDEEVGTIDQTLFIRRQRGGFILVQVYVDDIIFGSSNPQLCREFKALMHENFQMSTMGELNFFLGLQVLQKEDGIFLSQDKYVGYILKKFRYSDVRSSNTPMDKENPWGKDRTGKDVDLQLYRSMIG